MKAYSTGLGKRVVRAAEGATHARKIIHLFGVSRATINRSMKLVAASRISSQRFSSIRQLTQVRQPPARSAQDSRWTRIWYQRAHPHLSCSAIREFWQVTNADQPGGMVTREKHPFQAQKGSNRLPGGRKPTLIYC